MSDLVDYGVVQRGYLGVQIGDMTQELKEKENSLLQLVQQPQKQETIPYTLILSSTKKQKQIAAKDR